MSFRNRLTLFFVAIVILPMVSMAFVLFRLLSDNERGKADARIAARQETARNLFREDQERAGRIARLFGNDIPLARAIRARDDAAAARRLDALVQERGLARARISRQDGRVIADVGSRTATAVFESDLVDPRGARYRLELSDRTAPAYARSVRRITGLHVVVRAGPQTIGATLRDVPRGELPMPVGEVDVGDTEYRVASFGAREGFGSAGTRVSLFDGQEETDEAIGEARLLAGGLLAGFFILAFTFAAVVSRSLQSRIAAFLEAARRLGRGDFSSEVPIEGHDEFAALGREFNSMARQLEGRLQELGEQRTRLENQLRRIGEAFASNLDRDALLEIAVRTTVDGVAADGGRATLRPAGGDAQEERAVSGDPAGLADVIAQVEGEVLASGQPREVSAEGGSALGHPLRGARGEAEGVVSVWRRERPFAPSERELFHYLAAQAGISIENVELHETVQRQAVTDELTGLSNHRRFQEALASELERARRFETGIGLVMLDVDNFKQVNDTYGHQVGDRVLREVARVLRTESREVDEPARYGGEELAVILPAADLDGAYGLAERVRQGIASLEIPVDGDGRLKVTASFGAAALPESAHDQGTLIAAADAALYAAKRAGKNRTVRAQPEGARPSG
ncbi:MAG TPA: diguanylate cyclase [Solirubrobacteraceae bacterium]|nr:diguanylate cyclase [Solirubrobacteraceae bacterium]